MPLTITWEDVKGWTGIIAIAVSAASFWLSMANYRRDRPKLLVSNKFSPGWEGFDPVVEVSIVTAGRRRVILRGLGLQGNREKWAMGYMDHTSGGRRLGEHERMDLTLRSEDLIEQGPEAEFEIVDLWVEDTLGVRHKVRGARANLAQLRASTRTA